MKNYPVDYIKYPITSELLAQPIFWIKAIKRIRNNEKIEESLNKIIAETKRNTKVKARPSDLELDKFEIEYRELNNFFSNSFFSAEILNFEPRIDYVLKKYRQECNKLCSASNSIILEENFLKGARKTLSLYFILTKYNRISSDSILKERVFNVIEDEFFEEFNKVFSPEMDRGEILIFLYNIYNQPKNVVIKYRCWTKAYCIIYILSKLIKNKDGREQWLRNILEYFDIKEDRYEKKKKYHYCDDSSKILEGKHKQWGAKMSSYLIEYN